MKPAPRPRANELATSSGWDYSPLTIQVSVLLDWAVIVVAGELDGTVADSLIDVLDVADGSGATRLVIMATDLEFIDFAGVDVLVAAARRARSRGGSLVVADANPDVAEVLTFSGQRNLLVDGDSTHLAADPDPRRPSVDLRAIVDVEPVRARCEASGIERAGQLRRRHRPRPSTGLTPSGPALPAKARRT